MIPAASRAVMAQRHEPSDSLDFFPTPPWATRALCVHVFAHLALQPLMERCAFCDPACGEGHMVEVLREFFGGGGWGSDIFDYGHGYPVADFLGTGTLFGAPGDGIWPHFIVTNPPFKPSADFALRALMLAPVVALLLRTVWVEGGERYHALFRDCPPTLFAPFVERVPIVKGRWDPEAGTATAYAWFVWVRGRPPLPPYWIPPGCRTRLTRPDDAARFARPNEAPLLSLIEPA